MKLREIARKGKSMMRQMFHPQEENHHKPSTQNPASSNEPPTPEQTPPPLGASKTTNDETNLQTTDSSRIPSQTGAVSGEGPSTSVDGRLCKGGPSLGPDAEDSVSSRGQVLRPISSLWHEAYSHLLVKKETAEIFKKYGEILEDAENAKERAPIKQPANRDLPPQEKMIMLIDKKVEEVDSETWKLKFKGHELAVKDVVQSVASIVAWGKSLVGAAVQASPPAALAWVGVCLLLPLLLAPGEQDASRVKGLDMIASIIKECSLRETLYNKRYESETGTVLCANYAELHKDFRASIKELYSEILVFQATFVCYLSDNNSLERWIQDIRKKNDWDKMMNEISRKNEQLKSQEQKWELIAQQEQREWEAEIRRHQEDAHRKEAKWLRELVEERNSQEDRKVLLHWLRGSQAPSRHRNAAAQQRNTPETGKWFVDGTLFESWSKKPNSFLWIIGKAGAGKSILSSTIIERLEALRGDDPYKAVAYYYITSGEPETFRINNLTRSLIAQLFGKRPDTPETLLRLGECRETSGAPLQSELDEALRSAVSDFTDTYVVIDGLDECPASGNNVSGKAERRILLELLQRMQAWRLANLHLLVTSRQEQDIDDAFKGIIHDPQDEIIDLGTTAYSSSVRSDISMFMDKELNKEIFVDLPDNLKTLIRECLIDKAKGVFHYVSLQIESFKPPMTEKRIKTVLKSLPKDLNATYERVLVNKLEDEQKQDACHALTWLAFSHVPLTVTQLAAAVPIRLSKDWTRNRITPGEDYLDSVFDPKDRIEVPKHVLYLLPGLYSLAIRDPAEDGSLGLVTSDNTKPDETVSLTHSTLLDYLTLEAIKKQDTKQFALSGETSHLQLADACLRYHWHISHKGFDMLNDQQLQAEYPLWRYAAHHGLRHAEEIDQQKWPECLRDLIRRIFQDEANSFAKLKLHSGYAPRRDQDLPIQYVVDQSLVQSFEFLLEEGLADVNLGLDGSNKLLMQAVENRDAVVAKSLLENHDASANATSDEGKPAVLVSYRKKDVDMVKLLLEHGADINIFSEEGKPAVLVSCKENDFEMVKILLNHGADINAANKIGETILFEAAFLNDTKMAAHFASSGADVLATRSGETAFHWAAYHNSTDLADILLGADGSRSTINARTERGETPLHWAAAYDGKLEILRWLLVNGAEVNAKMNDGETALHIAARRQDSDAMELLLDHGADIDAVNGAGETALFLVARDTEGRSRRW